MQPGTGAGNATESGEERVYETILPRRCLATGLRCATETLAEPLSFCWS